MANYDLVVALQRHYDNSAARLVQSLRDLADRVEREAQPREGKRITNAFDEHPVYADAAQAVLNEIFQGGWRMDALSLLRDATNVDIATRMPQEDR